MNFHKEQKHSRKGNVYAVITLINGQVGRVDPLGAVSGAIPVKFKIRSCVGVDCACVCLALAPAYHLFSIGTSSSRSNLLSYANIP